MLTLLVFLSAFLFFTCIGFLLLHRFYQNRMTIYRRVSPYLTKPSEQELIGREDEINNRPFFARVVQPQILKLRRKAERRLPRQKILEIEKRLHAAGYPLGLRVGDFLLLQITLPIFVFLLYVVLLMPPSEDKLKVAVLGFITAILVYLYTNYYLSVKSKQRTQLIERSLPDFFDLLNVSIEAGMGLDGALKKVCVQMDSPLSKEFLSTLEDMNLGKSRREAFIDLRERVPSDFFKSVMTSIIQADQMGLGISKVLQTQSLRIREKQRFEAKEQAMKAPIKMLIPMVFFIFPTLFIVLLGPVVIELLNSFL